MKTRKTWDKTCIAFEGVILGGILVLKKNFLVLRLGKEYGDDDRK